MSTLKESLKKINNPWEDNPSKPENFYGIREEEEAVEGTNEEEEAVEDTNETVKAMCLDMKFVEESVEDDPYAQILKDLK